MATGYSKHLSSIEEDVQVEVTWWYSNSMTTSIRIATKFFNGKLDTIKFTHEVAIDDELIYKDPGAVFSAILDGWEDQWQYKVAVIYDNETPWSDPVYHAAREKLVNWMQRTVDDITNLGYVNEKGYTLVPVGEKKVSTDKRGQLSDLAKNLPGVLTNVEYPCGCSCSERTARSSIYNIIIHLNDTHKMSREKIADWLDELHDKQGINMEFQPWQEGKHEDN